MARRSHCLIFSSLLVLGTAGDVAADNEKSATEFSAQLGIGGEYDSNVSIEELDANSNQSDYALIMDAELGVEHKFSDATNASLSYDFSQSMYQEFSELDRQTHLLGADINTDFGKIDTGLSLFYINARLDGEAFLEYYRASPYLSGFLAKRWFTRGAYVYSDRSIEQNDGRDGESHAGELDLYYFRRGLRSYFNLGYKYKDEDAREDRFDYEANSLKFRYIHRLDVANKPLKLEFAWRYEDRDYSGITPSIGEEREDKRHRVKFDAEYPVSERGAIQFYASYGDYDSNYPRSDYTQEVFGTRYTYSW